MSGFATVARGGGQNSDGSNTTNAASQTTFGETLVAQVTTRGYGTFTHGINPALFTSQSNGAGSTVTALSGSGIVKSGTSTSGSASLRLTRGVTYKPGLGSLCRLTALFGPPVAGTAQIAGLGNTTSGYYFGYSGTSFGVLHVEAGVREIWQHNIIAGVANGTSVTVTLEGTPLTFTCNGSNNVNQTAHEIAKQDYSNCGRGWDAESYGSSVYFISNRVGPITSTVTSSIATSTITKATAGVSATTSFVTQSAWNIDTMDGNGPSRMVLNHARGNVYQVGAQYLGYGNGRLAIENPETGHFQAVHMFKNTNARTTPVFADPHMFGRMSVVNNGSATGTYMSGSSIASFTEGQVAFNVGVANSISATKSSISTEVPILTIRSNKVFNGKGVFGEITLTSLNALFIENGSGTRAGTIRIYKNAILTGPVNFQYVSSTKSIVSYDTAATGFALNDGRLIATYKIPSNTQFDKDTLTEDFYLSQGEKLTITAECPTTATSVDVSLNWFEEQ